MAAVLALSGGVGGAKLCLGLQQCLPAEDLHIAVNTGDDFEHLGLSISPDIDTLLYTLSGRASQSRGWGLSGETWQAMDALAELGGDSWFRLGDRDLATHLWRSTELASGRSLSAVTADLAQRMGIACAIHPMSDQPVRTTVHCDEGALPFQHYFVRRQCEPAVSHFSFEGLNDARVNPALDVLLRESALSAIVICPSNPFVSVDPILQLPAMVDLLRASGAPVVAVSPIVAGMAIKGPAAKMMAELGMPVTALAVAEHYANRYPGLVTHFVIDNSDAELAEAVAALGMAVTVTATVMSSDEDKQRLAAQCLELAA